jgi:uncharacterized membrane protein YhaH (DUF805 family)
MDSKKGVMNLYIDGWKKSFVYKGRSTRREYWSFTLGQVLITLLLCGFMLLFDKNGPCFVPGMSVLLYWALSGLNTLATIPYIAVTCRRLHDRGHSGWWQVSYFLFIIGANIAAYDGSEIAGPLATLGLLTAFAIFVMLLLPSSKSDNEYGPAPY